LLAWPAEAAAKTALLIAPRAEDALEEAQDLLRQLGQRLMLYAARQLTVKQQRRG
jgi:hypothetical protein